VWAARGFEIGGRGQAEAEVHDAAWLAGLLGVDFEDQYVPGAWGLQLDEGVAAVDLDRAEDLSIDRFGKNLGLL
jgi:hypothetical protein